MKNSFLVLVLTFFSLFFSLCTLQAQQTDSLLDNATLPNVIQYALKRQTAIQQSLIDEKITELEIKSKLSEWYPQINLNYLYQHYFQLQSSVVM
jgi:outer membrane protein TolC